MKDLVQASRWIAVMGMLAMGGTVDAQIYECRAADGTRIFSGEKCGPDAKIVPGITTKQRATPGASSGAAARPPVTPKTPAELEELLKKCNAGDIPSCNTWTRGGGPNSLKQKEREAEQACEAGSLADCEFRYCSGGANDECRFFVLQAAKVSGENWYLREGASPQPDGSTRYEVRCMPVGVRTTRDIAITCAAQAGLGRCVGAPAADLASGYPRLDVAATALCAK